MKTSRSCSDSALPRRPKPSVVLLAVALGIGAVVAPMHADTAVRNAAIAASLTAGARDAITLGYDAEAMRLLDEALSYAPADADANYLRALTGAAAGESPALTIPHLETALASNDFRTSSALEARLLYASLLVRTHRSAQAMRMLAGLPHSAEYLYVECRAALALANADLSRSDVLESLRRYPADPRPLIFWLQASSRPYALPADMAVVKAAFEALDALKDIDPSVLVALAPYAPDAETGRLLIREFRATGGQSPRATVLALRYGLIAEAKAMGELFGGSYVPAPTDITELLGLLSSDENRAGFRQAFAGFSGVVPRDDDRDQFPESVTRYQDGQPVAWMLDADQDGRPELEMVLAAGEPQSAVAHAGSTTVAIRYGPWPHAVRLDFSDAAGRRSYALGPSVFAAPLVRFDPIMDQPGAPYLIRRDDASLPTERGVATLAYAVETRDTDRTTDAELYDGIPERSWWHDAVGGSGMVIYARGLPSDERLDLDGDGRSEARRVWGRSADGTARPLYIEMDLNDDGLYEYRESLVEPFIKSWDYDSDGAVDLAMQTMPDGRSLYSIPSETGSPRLTTILYRSGSIERVENDGSPLSLTPDSSGRVVWIGVKPFDLASDAIRPGYGSRNGIAYRIVDIGGRLYAQVIR